VHRILTVVIGRKRAGASTDAPARRRVRLVFTMLAVLALAAQVACGSTTGNGTGEACQQTPAPDRPQNRDPGTGPKGAPGSASIPRHTAPPAGLSPSPTPPPPTPVNGRVMLTAANSLQTIVVPAGTLIDVRLEPVSDSVWTVPESSDPQALPRLSASGTCDTVKEATFRAVGEGHISATRPHAGDAQVRLIVTVHVSG
jgi:hypothetical protein